MNESELKELIRHTMLLPDHARQRLLSMELEGPVLEKVSAFFAQYHPVESAVVSELEDEILQAKKVLQSHIEREEARESESESAQQISSILI